MALEYPIQLATGTEAEHSAADGNYMLGQASFTSDGLRHRIGDVEGNGILQGAQSTDVLTVNPAAVGYDDDEPFVLPSGYRRHVKTISLAAHTGTYTKKLSIPAQEDGAVAVEDGDELELIVTYPASTNPTLQIYNESSAGTLLATVHDVVASAHTYNLRFVRIGGAWVKAAFSEVL